MWISGNTIYQLERIKTQNGVFSPYTKVFLPPCKGKRIIKLRCSVLPAFSPLAILPARSNDAAVFVGEKKGKKRGINTTRIWRRCLKKGTTPKTPLRQFCLRTFLIRRGFAVSQAMRQGSRTFRDCESRRFWLFPLRSSG